MMPLGRVTGKASEVKFLKTPFVTGELQEKAIVNALNKKAGADILLNYTEFNKITPILFFWTKLSVVVEGTAAKMEIGTQELR